VRNDGIREKTGCRGLTAASESPDPIPSYNEPLAIQAMA